MSDSAGALPKRSMYLAMKARYSSCRLVGRSAASGASGVTASSTRVSSWELASTCRTVPSENRRISSYAPLTNACDTCRSLRRRVRDSESSCRAGMMIFLQEDLALYPGSRAGFQELAEDDLDGVLCPGAMLDLAPGQG